MGRPRKEIDQQNFEKLCGLQCTKEEICGFFDVTDKTLENWCRRTYKAGFSDVFAQKRGAGKISLRRYQFELAKKNANMAIFLGKNYLGQSDAGRIEIKAGGSPEDDALTKSLRELAEELMEERHDG